MSRRLTRIAVVLVAILALAQVIRPSRSNPPIDPSRTIHAQAGMTEVAVVLDRSCGDCHANLTVWPWYTQVAPVSWLMAYAVTSGRNAVNFSEWAAYSAEQQRILLALSCRDASEGKMPGAYARLRPETRLSAQDIATICAAAEHVESRRARVSR